MKVRLLFGSTLALGVLTGAPLFAQSPGTPPTPVGPPAAAPSTMSPFLPEQYARKFGTGSTGATAVRKALMDAKSSRAAIIEALDAATYYGSEGAAAIFRFASTLPKSQSGDPDASWYLPVITAMGRVPDRSFQPFLLECARRGADADIRAEALKSLASLVACSSFRLISSPTRSLSVGSGPMGHRQRSVGESQTLEEMRALKTVAESLKGGSNTPDTVQEEAERLLWWISFREEQIARAQTRFQKGPEGAPLPAGVGYGTFGSPPAER